MTQMVDRLEAQLKARGLSIKPGDKPGELRLSGPDREKTPDIIAALKVFKPDLLAKYGREQVEDQTPGETLAPPMINGIVRIGGEEEQGLTHVKSGFATPNQDFNASLPIGSGQTTTFRAGAPYQTSEWVMEHSIPPARRSVRVRHPNLGVLLLFGWRFDESWTWTTPPSSSDGGDS